MLWGLRVVRFGVRAHTEVILRGGVGSKPRSLCIIKIWATESVSEICRAGERKGSVLALTLRRASVGHAEWQEMRVAVQVPRQLRKLPAAQLLLQEEHL